MWQDTIFLSIEAIKNIILRNRPKGAFGMKEQRKRNKGYERKKRTEYNKDTLT